MVAAAAAAMIMMMTMMMVVVVVMKSHEWHRNTHAYRMTDSSSANSHLWDRRLSQLGYDTQ